MAEVQVIPPKAARPDTLRVAALLPCQLRLCGPAPFLRRPDPGLYAGDQRPRWLGFGGHLRRRGPDRHADG